jgi:hypothetical protein
MDSALAHMRVNMRQGKKTKKIDPGFMIGRTEYLQVQPQSQRFDESRESKSYKPFLPINF